MQDNLFTGIWYLEGYFNSSGQFEILADIEEYRRIYEKWLRDENYKNLENLTKTEGLRLEIKSDGTFTEMSEGNPQIEWFDEEGIWSAKLRRLTEFIQFLTNVLFSHCRIRPIFHTRMIPNESDMTTAIQKSATVCG